MDEERLRGLYGQLKGLREALNAHGESHVAGYAYENEIRDYHSVLTQLGECFGHDIERSWMLTGAMSKTIIFGQLDSKLAQLLGYLESAYELADPGLEVGSLYNSLADASLKDRCSDILTGRKNFDRVINQATLVLEDRIRQRAGLPKTLVGTSLVNKALNTDLAKTVLQVSRDQDEHEGICHICRGVMMAFRNPTHHHLTDAYSREDALKVCAFIDNLLQFIDSAHVKVGQQPEVGPES